MNRLVQLTALLFAIGATLSVADARAQQFEIETDALEATDPLFGIVEFHVTVRNLTAQQLVLDVRRVTNQLPDTSWTSFICYPGRCLDPATDAPEPLAIDPLGSQEVKLTVSAPHPGTGRVSVAFSTLGTGATTREFVVRNSGLSGAGPIDRNSEPLAVHPNPASTFTLIPIPQTTADAIRLEIYDAGGNRVADLSSIANVAVGGGARYFELNLSSMKNGSYIYRLAMGGAATSGRFVVVR